MYPCIILYLILHNPQFTKEIVPRSSNLETFHQSEQFQNKLCCVASQNRFSTHLLLQNICRCRRFFLFTLGFPKVERIISWLRISCRNSSTHFKVQVVDIIAFQTKHWTKYSFIFAKKLFHHIKSWFRHQKIFLACLLQQSLIFTD